MIDLRDYPRLGRMIRGSPDLGTAVDKLSDLYKDTRRLSGRLVIQHCFEACEIASHFTSETLYLIATIYHDGREDMALSFEDVKRMSGENGFGVAQIVTVLSKRYDLKDKAEREREYTERLAKSIEKNRWIGIIKLADRMSNLTDLYALPPEKRRAIAIQTLNFYVPLAFRLGIPRLANEMKELSLPHVLVNLERNINRDLPKEKLKKLCALSAL